MKMFCAAAIAFTLSTTCANAISKYDDGQPGDQGTAHVNMGAVFELEINNPRDEDWPLQEQFDGHNFIIVGPVEHQEHIQQPIRGQGFNLGLGIEIARDTPIY